MKAMGGRGQQQQGDGINPQQQGQMIQQLTLLRQYCQQAESVQDIRVQAAQARGQRVLAMAQAYRQQQQAQGGMGGGMGARRRGRGGGRQGQQIQGFHLELSDALVELQTALAQAGCLGPAGQTAVPMSAVPGRSAALASPGSLSQPSSWQGQPSIPSDAAGSAEWSTQAQPAVQGGPFGPALQRDLEPNADLSLV